MLPKRVLLLLPAHVAALNINPRQTSSPTSSTNDPLSACLDVLNPVLTSFPTLPPEIAKIMVLDTSITDGCAYTPAPTMAPVFTSVEKYIIWWMSESWSLVESALEKACPTEVNTYVEGGIKAFDSILCTERVKGVTRTATGVGLVTTQSSWDTTTVGDIPVWTRSLESGSGSLTETTAAGTVGTGTTRSTAVTTTSSTAGASGAAVQKGLVAAGILGAVLVL